MEQANSKKRILIVDDQTAVTQMIRLSLERTGKYEALEVNQGRAALAAAREFHPDLILLDVMMPDMDGGEVAAAIQKDPALKKVPVVFLTGAVQEQEASQQNRNGGAFFLAKPMRLNTLYQCVDNILRNGTLPAAGVNQHSRSPARAA